MPKSREEIKRDAVAKDVWQAPRTQVLNFDPLTIRPHGDHVLIVLDADPVLCFRGRILTPDVIEPNCAPVLQDEAHIKTKLRIGTVVAVGPGKWIEKRKYTESWMLNPQVFVPTVLKPGMRVAIGSYSDWESWNCDSGHHDYAGGRNVVLCQEADVRFILDQEDTPQN